MGDVEIPNPDDLAELKEKAFTRQVALTAVIYAVVLSINALGGSNAGKNMLLAQQQASDQWAFYQAKAVREHLYKIERMKLEVEIAERTAGMNRESVQKYQELLDTFQKEELRYSDEKKKIEAEAKALEKTRDLNQSKDPYFDYAEVLLQIGLVMATLAVLSGSHTVYWFSTLLAGLGSLMSLNGFLLLVRIPFLE